MKKKMMKVKILVRNNVGQILKMILIGEGDVEGEDEGDEEGDVYIIWLH